MKNRNITDKTEAAEKGRMGDSYTAHVQDGEMVLPDDLPPELMAVLHEYMESEGYSPDDYMVGGEPTINPETGEPEYFSLGKVFKKITNVAKKVISSPVGQIGLGFALPGIGSALGAGLGLGSLAGTSLAGAGIGALSGGGLKGALGGALGGFGAAGGGGILGSSLGLAGAGAKGLGGALLGAAGGGIAGGDLKSAILGGGASGLSALYQSGGFKNLGSSFKSSGLSGALSQFGDNLSGTGDILQAGSTGNVGGGGGSSYSVPSANAGKLLDTTTLASGERINWNPSAETINWNGGGQSVLNAPQGEDMASGFLDRLTSGKGLSSVLNSGIGTMTNNKATDQLLEQQQKGLAALKPYMNFQYTPQDLENDPGYQFQLSQGQKALDRSAASKGSYFSGDALRAAGDYATGLADQTYNQAYNRAWQGNQNNIQNVLAQYGIQSDIGNTNATNTVANSNLWTDSIANLLNPQTDEDIFMKYLRGMA